MRNNIPGLRQSNLKSSSMSSADGFLEASLLHRDIEIPFVSVVCHTVGNTVLSVLENSIRLLSPLRKTSYHLLLGGG